MITAKYAHNRYDPESAAFILNDSEKIQLLFRILQNYSAIDREAIREIKMDPDFFSPKDYGYQILVYGLCKYLEIMPLSVHDAWDSISDDQRDHLVNLLGELVQ